MHSMKSLAAAAAALALAACGQQPAPEAEQPAQTPTEQPSGTAQTPQELDPLFEQAAREFDVPADLLKSISFAETRWTMVRGHEEFEGQPAARGVMALRGANLEAGARAAGVSVDAASTDALSNIRAAAALLSSYAGEANIDRADLGAWAPAAARLSGISGEDAQAEFIHSGVYKALREGVVAENASGGVLASLMPRAEVRANFAPLKVRAMAAGPDYAAADWQPSPNYGARPSGAIGDPAYIIIHTCEGNYAGCWGWLKNPSAGVSAHYVVSEDGSDIKQLVRESDRAWHIGAKYDCTLNSNVDCWRNGYGSNDFTIGIEHAGFAGQASFPVSQIDASAKLSCDISKGQAVPRDRYHIVAHGQLQPATRTDPGPNWPWSDYISRIQTHCADAIIVDSNNANNDTSKGYIQVSTNWTSSSSTSGYYGSGYYYASTQAVSDAAVFFFNMPAAGTRTIEAWWTAGTNRAPAATFIANNAAGTEVGRATVDQQVNGGKWVTLGTYNFTAGWNKVQLSRWTTENYVVIADAIRVK
ncbi:N-acetylmuramoyl-L-alanine amidase [Myxococcaceae bacterium GXIMD 01537]